MITAVEALPTELLEGLLVLLTGSSLRLLIQYSPRCRALMGNPRVRHRWLHEQGLSICFSNTPKIVAVTWELDPHWASLIYGRLTIWGRVEVIEGLLADRDTWGIARELAIRERTEDALLDDPSYGIFQRHLQWRFTLCGCPV